MSEFDPNRKRRNAIFRPAQNVVNQTNLKDQLMNWYDKCIEIKTFDPGYLQLKREVTSLSNELLKGFAVLKSGEIQPDEVKTLDIKMSEIDTKHIEKKQELTNYLKNKMPDFAEKHVSLFEILAHQDIDRTTIEHVFTTFDACSKGELTPEAGKLLGENYMTQTYNLPPDMFTNS